MNTSELHAAISDFVTTRRQALDALAAAMSHCLAVSVAVPATSQGSASGVSKPKTKARAGRRSPIAPGSVPDRLLELLRESDQPMKLAALLEGAKARPNTVKEALRALVAAKRIVKLGATLSLRYALPGKATA